MPRLRKTAGLELGRDGHHGLGINLRSRPLYLTPLPEKGEVSLGATRIWAQLASERGTERHVDTWRTGRPVRPSCHSCNQQMVEHMEQNSTPTRIWGHFRKLTRILTKIFESFVVFSSIVIAIYWMLMILFVITKGIIAFLNH
jgi:hypothetical protein